MRRTFFTVLLSIFAFAAAAGPDDGSRTGKPPLIYVSWGDEIVGGSGDGRLDTPDKISAMMKFWREELGAETILWRISSEWLIRFCDFADPENYHLKLYRKLNKEFNPMEIAVREAHRHGLKILAYQTIFDQGMPPGSAYGGKPYPWQSKFIKAHPQYQVTDRTRQQYQPGVPELAYPEVRRQIIDETRYFVDRYGFDGVYWCTRTHSTPVGAADEMGFGEPVEHAYRERYGADLRTPDFDPERWRRLRGESFVAFLAESRAAWPDKIIIAGIPRGRYFGPPYGNLYLDYESIIRRRLVDQLVIGVWSGAWLHPQFPHDYPQMGYLCADETGFNVPDWPAAIDMVYGPLCRQYGVRLAAFSGDARLLTRPGLDALMLDCPTPLHGIARLPHHDQLAGRDGHLTVELRFNPASRGATLQPIRHILSKYGHADQADRGYQLSLLPDGRVQFRFQDPNGNSIALLSRTVVPLQRWTHVAGVVDPTNRRARLYIDGRLEDDTSDQVRAVTGVQNNPAVDLYLGRYGAYNEQNFEGMIDELVIWPEAREYTAAPTAPYSADELKTAIAAFDFDTADRGFIPSLVGGPALEVLRPNQTPDQRFQPVDSAPRFGRALKIEVRKVAP